MSEQIPVWIVYEEWERGGDGGHAIPIAAFTGESAEARAHAFAGTHIQALSKDFNVYAVTGADDYDGDDDPSDWEVDVHVEELTANPDQRVPVPSTPVRTSTGAAS